MSIPIIDEVVEQLKAMPQHLQRQVLQFVRSLAQTQVPRYTWTAIIAVCRFNST
jgi:hypothetical protein